MFYCFLLFDELPLPLPMLIFTLEILIPPKIPAPARTPRIQSVDVEITIGFPHVLRVAQNL